MNTPKVKEILSWYGSDSHGTWTNLARLSNHGKLGGTGRLVILPVDREVTAIRQHGGFGSFMGRNSFQRKKPEAWQFLGKTISIYAS
jgi:DhnA family fructose-bisphosphate aldolase class Ia